MLRRCLALVFTLPLAAQGWTNVTPFANPSPRYFPAMCYDVAHGYVLMVGSYDTWSWNGTSWTGRGSTTFASPQSQALAYHPPPGLPVLVANQAAYTWDGSSWTFRSSLPTGIGNSDLALAYDPTRSQMVCFMGSMGAGNPTADTVLWDGFGWTLRQPAVRPYPPYYGHMAFDPVAGKLLLATSDLNHSQTFFWEWDGATWNQRIFASSPTMSGPMVTDTVHNTIVSFDGSLDPAPNHTWTFANGIGSRLGTSTEPSHRYLAGGAFDPVRGKFVLFGGSNNYVNPYNAQMADTWEFDLGASASFTAYGAGCSGSRGTPTLAPQNNTLPHVGQTLELHLGNLPFTGPVFVFLGISNTVYGPTPLPFSLAGLGAPGCTVVSSCEAVLPLTNVLGSAVWQLAVPNMPGVTFYTQAVVLDGAANTLGITTSNGGQNTIGF